MCDKLIQDQKREMEIFYQDINTDKIEEMVNLILEEDRNVFFCGVGKSENIGSHTADMLKSIGVKAFSISPTNSLHGDLGVVRENDIVFLYSKSGNTKELMNTVKFFKSHGCYIFGVFCNESAKLLPFCDNSLIMPVGKEIDGHFDLVPTTSFLNYVILCNIIVSRIIQKKELTLTKYGKNHPAGDIGRNSLLMVEDVMLKPSEFAIIDFNSPIKEAAIRMSEKRIGFCILVNENNDFVGVLSDGDIRRIFIDDVDMYTPAKEVGNMYPKEIIDNIKLSLNEYFKNYSQDFVPVVENRKVLGLVYRNRI